MVISYRPRSALRDVGRALGLDLDRIAAVAKGQHWFDGREIADDRLREDKRLELENTLKALSEL